MKNHHPVASTLSEIVLQMRQRPAGDVALQFKKDGQWQSHNWQEYYSEIEKCALGLMDCGVKPGDRIVIFSNTRVEWSISDFAILGIGGVVVPVYQTVTAEDLE